MSPSVEFLAAEGADPVAREQAIAVAASRLRDGGVIAVPTESLYAYAVREDAPAAAAVLGALARPARVGTALGFADPEGALAALPSVTPAAHRLARRYFP